MIPIDENLWHRLPEEELRLPAKHYAEYARTDNDELVVRIVGPNAHVIGQDPDVWEAAQKALTWFNSVGGEL